MMTKQYTFEEQQKILNSPFDVKVHKHAFINYCEAILWPDGRLEYAIPSHDQKLINEYAKLKGKDVKEVMDELKNSTCFPYYLDIMKELGIAFIWYDRLVVAKKLTREQHKTLSMLITNECVSDELLADMVFLTNS